MRSSVLAILLALSMAINPILVFAEKEELKIDEIKTEATEIAQENKTLTVTVSMLPRMKVKDSVAVIELFSEDGERLGAADAWIGGITDSFVVSFDVPSLKSGDKYIIKLKGGLTYLKYYDKEYKQDEEIEVTLYGYLDENDKACVSNNISLEGCPLYEKAIVTYVRGEQVRGDVDARLIDATAMIPVRAIAESLGLKVRYDEIYNSVVCEIEDKQAIFNVGTAYATFMGRDTFLPRACEMIEDRVFVPVRALAEAFECTVEAIDFDDHIDVCIGDSPIIREYLQKIPVNQWELSSRTKYLVWIDKSDFKVRVYKGSKNNWVEEKRFSCSIGAVDSPTPTGSYEYQYRMSHWDYPGYYVGPCLVFYGNYALHSTLQSYGGGVVDDRVNARISHGCIRLRKADIDWLDKNLPLNSRIYITE